MAAKEIRGLFLKIRGQRGIKFLAFDDHAFFKRREKKETSLPKFLTLGSLARRVGLTPDAIFWLCRKGCLKCQYSKGKMFFSKNEAERWIRETSK